MKSVDGDLLALALDGTFEVIVHGCNCQCSMGAGIAKAIKSIFPEAYEADCRTAKGDREKLGTISHANVIRNAHHLTIVNGYTQFHWRGSGVLVDYDAVRSVFRTVKEQFTGHTIGYPLIGAGLARGDWTTIVTIIEEELANENHKLVRYANHGPGVISENQT